MLDLCSLDNKIVHQVHSHGMNTTSRFTKYEADDALRVTCSNYPHKYGATKQDKEVFQGYFQHFLGRT